MNKRNFYIVFALGLVVLVFLGKPTWRFFQVKDLSTEIHKNYKLLPAEDQIYFFPVDAKKITIPFKAKFKKAKKFDYSFLKINNLRDLNKERRIYQRAYKELLKYANKKLSINDQIVKVIEYNLKKKQIIGALFPNGDYVETLNKREDSYHAELAKLNPQANFGEDSFKNLTVDNPVLISNNNFKVPLRVKLKRKGKKAKIAISRTSDSIDPLFLVVSKNSRLKDIMLIDFQERIDREQSYASPSPSPVIVVDGVVRHPFGFEDLSGPPYDYEPDLYGEDMPCDIQIELYDAYKDDWDEWDSAAITVENPGYRFEIEKTPILSLDQFRKFDLRTRGEKIVSLVKKFRKPGIKEVVASDAGLYVANRVDLKSHQIRVSYPFYSNGNILKLEDIKISTRPRHKEAFNAIGHQSVSFTNKKTETNPATIDFNVYWYGKKAYEESVYRDLCYNDYNDYEFFFSLKFNQNRCNVNHIKKLTVGNAIIDGFAISTYEYKFDERNFDISYDNDKCCYDINIRQLPYLFETANSNFSIGQYRPATGSEESLHSQQKNPFLAGLNLVEHAGVGAHMGEAQLLKQIAKIAEHGSFCELKIASDPPIKDKNHATCKIAKMKANDVLAIAANRIIDAVNSFRTSQQGRQWTEFKAKELLGFTEEYAAVHYPCAYGDGAELAVMPEIPDELIG